MLWNTPFSERVKSTTTTVEAFTVPNMQNWPKNGPVLLTVTAMPIIIDWT